MLNWSGAVSFSCWSHECLTVTLFLLSRIVGTNKILIFFSVSWLFIQQEVLSCPALWCAVLRCAVLRCAALCCAVLCCAALQDAPQQICDGGDFPEGQIRSSQNINMGFFFFKFHILGRFAQVRISCIMTRSYEQVSARCRKLTGVWSCEQL